MKALEYPETTNYTPGHISTKTAKLPNGQFGAIGAIFFMGKRGQYVGAVGRTRYQAEKAVMAILDPDPHAAWRSETRLRMMGG